MIKIVAAMCVAGDPAYFRFASHSIPSFLRNNVDTDLYVFTDKPTEIEKHLHLSKRLRIVNIENYFNSHQEEIDKLKRGGLTKEDMHKYKETFGYVFRDVFPAAMPPMAEEMLKNKGYTHILKIDSEGYFAGGNMMAMLKTEVLNKPHVEIFLVERRHPLMHHHGGGVPGSGFTLWRIGSKFVSEYIRSFNGNQQVTILAMRFSRKIVVEIMTRPGYHFVRPFWKAKQTGKEFTKEIASLFLPAYFHLHGQIALKGFARMEEWFGGNPK